MGYALNQKIFFHKIEHYRTTESQNFRILFHKHTHTHTHTHTQNQPEDNGNHTVTPCCELSYLSYTSAKSLVIIINCFN